LTDLCTISWTGTAAFYCLLFTDR